MVKMQTFPSPAEHFGEVPGSEGFMIHRHKLCDYYRELKKAVTERMTSCTATIRPTNLRLNIRRAFEHGNLKLLKLAERGGRIPAFRHSCNYIKLGMRNIVVGLDINSFVHLARR